MCLAKQHTDTVILPRHSKLDLRRRLTVPAPAPKHFRFGKVSPCGNIFNGLPHISSSGRKSDPWISSRRAADIRYDAPCRTAPRISIHVPFGRRMTRACGMHFSCDTHLHRLRCGRRGLSHVGHLRAVDVKAPLRDPGDGIGVRGRGDVRSHLSYLPLIKQNTTARAEPVTRHLREP